jgi:hypothetical protein
LFVN